jgi:4-amino-4-deoxy-L-arabinose transferase-like glycosyltransferase
MSTARSNDDRILTAILISAFLVRLTAALVLPNQGFPDAQRILDVAHRFWHTFQISSPHVMPLYPILVGITGGGWGQLLLDISLSTVAVWLIYALAWELFGDRIVSLFAATGAALYPYFIFYSIAGVTETLFIALLMAAFLAWYRGAFAVGAVFAVLGILTRPSIELLVPILVGYFAFVIHRCDIRSTARHVLVYGLVYVALMAPWWLHNYAAYGSFVRLNLQSGFVLYSGNNPMNHSGGGIDGVDLDNHRFDDISDPAARDRAFRDAALTYIKEHPGRFVELAWLKFVRFWQPWPYAQEYKSSFYVVVSILSYGPILLLSLLYLRLWGRQDLRKIGPVLIFTVYLTAVHCVLIGSIRYRLPIEPFLIIFASVALRRLLASAWKFAPAATVKQPSGG